MLFDRKRFSGNDVDIIDRQTVFEGFFKMERLVMRHRLFSGAWGAPITRELFARGEAVGVLLYDPVNRLVGLVEQFRTGALDEPNGPWLLEVVAGMVEPNEAPEVVAERELVEEAGIDQVRLHRICDYLVSPGGTSEKMHLFCGVANLAGRGGVFGLGSEGEDILFHVIPENQVFEAFEKGLCNNAATTICLLWLQQNRQKLAS